MTDINKELFRRTSPSTKMAMINNLSSSDFLMVSENTMRKVFRNMGHIKVIPIKDKRNDEQIGNNWNSNINAISIERGKIFIYLYVQYYNTDTVIPVRFSNFMRKGDFVGNIQYSDIHGYQHIENYRYSESIKSKIVKAALEYYVHTKFDDVTTIHY